MPFCTSSSFFFFNDTATTEIYTLSLHDALPISILNRDLKRQIGIEVMTFGEVEHAFEEITIDGTLDPGEATTTDRKSTRLNSSHSQISYAVFCLKKKKKKKHIILRDTYHKYTNR